MAVINRERKIAVIKEGTDYSWSIETGLPKGYAIYKTDEDIPIYDITEPKNKKVLIKMHITYLIKKYLGTFYHEYKVLNSVSKQIPYYYDVHREQYFTEIKGFAYKYKFIPKCKPLYTKPYCVNNYKVDFPTIKAILENKLFTDEEKLKIEKCKFYTKFCLHKGISWKELDENWSDDYIEEVKIKDKAKDEDFDKLAKRYADKSEANYKEALSKVNSSVSIYEGMAHEIPNELLEREMFPITDVVGDAVGRLHIQLKTDFEAADEFLLFIQLPCITIEEKADNFVVCEKDHGYIPNLYQFEDEYAIDWIHVSESDSLHVITGITPKKAIRNAFKWCLDKGLITNPTYIK